MKEFTEVESRSVRCEMEAGVVLKIVQLAVAVSYIVVYCIYFSNTLILFYEKQEI